MLTLNCLVTQGNDLKWLPTYRVGIPKTNIISVEQKIYCYKCQIDVVYFSTRPRRLQCTKNAFIGHFIQTLHYFNYE